MKCLHSFRTKDKLESRKKVCENKDFCSVVMPTEDSKILKFNQYRKSGKIPSITYAGLEYLVKRIDSCKNNSEKSLQQKCVNIFLADIQCLRYGRPMV